MCSSEECVDEASVELFRSEGKLEVPQAVSATAAAALNAHVNVKFREHVEQRKLRADCLKNLQGIFASNGLSDGIYHQVLEQVAPHYRLNDAVPLVWELMQSEEGEFSEGSTADTDGQWQDDPDLESYGLERYLFHLQLFDKPVVAALQEALPKLEPVLRAALGADSIMIECSVLIVDPDSPSQALHADTMWTPCPEVVIVFVALQDVTADMGPTQMLPRTHADPAFWQKAIDENDPEKILSEPEYLQSTLGTPPMIECQVSSGTAILMDTRLLHCGGANRSDKRRNVMSLTFAKLDCAKDVPEVPKDVDLDTNVSMRRVANSQSYQRVARALKDEYGDLLTLRGLTEKLASSNIAQYLSANPLHTSGLLS